MAFIFRPNYKDPTIQSSRLINRSINESNLPNGSIFCDEYIIYIKLNMRILVVSVFCNIVAILECNMPMIKIHTGYQVEIAYIQIFLFSKTLPSNASMQ